MYQNHSLIKCLLSIRGSHVWFYYLIPIQSCAACSFFFQLLIFHWINERDGREYWTITALALKSQESENGAEVTKQWLLSLSGLTPLVLWVLILEPDVCCWRYFPRSTICNCSSTAPSASWVELTAVVLPQGLSHAEAINGIAQH